MTGVEERLEGNNDEEEIDSADEALLEMLGLVSMDVKADDVEEEDEHHHQQQESATPAGNAPLQDQITWLNQRDVESAFQNNSLQEEYKTTGVCVFPSSLNVPAVLMRRLSDELVWGGENSKSASNSNSNNTSQTTTADKTYENITIMKSDGEIRERRTLTRFENFADHHHHPGWHDLCHNYLQRCISALMGQEMVLFKEKLNLKPPGGSGFAPHLDGPSLRVALGDNGPKTFVTVMVAIDTMTIKNGCLRVAKGPWLSDDDDKNHTTCEVVEPDKDGSPDAGGRAGAIPPAVADSLEFDDLLCTGGSIVAFTDQTPHRSSSNASAFSRRAVFLTYNSLAEGDFRAQYYAKMESMRNEWRSNNTRTQQQNDQQNEMDALASIPN